MSREFLVDMSKLARAYGKPLTLRNDPIRYSYYQDEARFAGVDLSDDVILGTVAYGAHIVGDIPILTELSLLNESFGVMRDHGDGQLCGSVNITAMKTTPDKRSGELILSHPLYVDLLMYTNGQVEVASTLYDKKYPQLREHMAKTGVMNFELDEDPERYTLHVAQERGLNHDQLAQLRTYVVGAFVELDI